MTNSEFNRSSVSAHATRNSAHVSANDAAAKTSEPTSATNCPTNQNREDSSGLKPSLSARTNKLRATNSAAVATLANA